MQYKQYGNSLNIYNTVIIIQYIQLCTLYIHTEIILCILHSTNSNFKTVIHCPCTVENFNSFISRPMLLQWNIPVHFIACNELRLCPWKTSVCDNSARIVNTMVSILTCFVYCVISTGKIQAHFHIEHDLGYSAKDNVT